METSARNVLSGRIKRIEDLGLIMVCEVSIENPGEITVVVDRKALEFLSIKEGDDVLALINPNQIVVRPKK